MSFRVLFVAHTLPLPGRPLSNLGGLQRMSIEVLAALEAHPEIHLSKMVLESSSRWTGLRTAPFLARLLIEIPRRVREEAIDVVLFSSMVTASTAPFLRRRLRGLGPLLAATPAGLDVTLPNALHQRLVPRIFAALDLILPISRATAAECLARKAPADRIRVIPVGADPARFPAVVDRAAARAELLTWLAESGAPPVPDGALLLCGIGRHQERKGFHWFVDQVMPRLPEDVVYLLGGTGPMTPVIRAAIERHGLGARVRLLGVVPEARLGVLYRGSDVFVMPNISVPGDIEGFGLVMLEAGLSGLPTIGADIEGIRDVVTPGQNGELLPAGDAEAFAGAIRRAHADAAARAEASGRARSFTAEHFAWSGIVDQYVAAFRSCATRS